MALKDSSQNREGQSISQPSRVSNSASSPKLLKSRGVGAKRGRGGQKDLTREPEKERVINDLTKILAGTGVVVRREKLKRGPGWRVVSGICRAIIKPSAAVLERASGAENPAAPAVVPEQFVFVDRALPQEEQITFLCARLGEAVRRGAQVNVTTELFDTLPAAGKALLIELVVPVPSAVSE